ncbi:MAG: hypothetical protein A2Y62_09565 [Candidatus Fischerbacteria bacterium RBG_13_37_8]|uniref:Protochlamydia outer membrane protein domain-containing protein n=1 Tax=Candidatus Fischerbacteria bacterium RBG_13_37_8 TaxID=1817863 RepID=A0A1F5VJR4_9BACT|nr:MAG: hypothetical protein A2Y62_09565 [Candidatus Fischerbacteria bacterium RBG_13_37_8]
MLLCSIFVSAEDTNSKNKWKFSITIEPVWMGVKGNDVQVGETVKSIREIIYEPEYSYDQTIVNEPIIIDMRNKLTLRMEAVYENDYLGWGGSIWWFNTKGTKNDTIYSPKDEQTLFGWTEYDNSVRFWNYNFKPGYNDLVASGKSPVIFNAKNSLDIWMGEIFGSLVVSRYESNTITMLFGVQFGSMTNSREETITQENIWRSLYYSMDERNSFANNVEADYGLIFGPEFGFQQKARFKKISLENTFKQSFLRSSVSHDGLLVATSHGFNSYEYNDEIRISFSEKSTVTVPVTDVKFKVMVDVSKQFSVGLSGFASLWWNARLASALVIEDYSPESASWLPQKSSLCFYGIAVSFTVHI